jgi:antitoxin PrlF
MPTRTTTKGKVTVPKRVREALRLAAGDAVEFRPNGNGEFVLCKASPATDARRARRVNGRTDAQMRRRAAELLALLRGLD